MLCVLLALVNGMVIGTSRAINGQLSASAGPLRASLWNHAVGFGLLSLMLLWLPHPHADPATLPVGAWLGGVFGALFVAVNSLVFTRLGAMRSVLLVIGGQLLVAVLIDWLQRRQAPGVLRGVGVALMLLGMYGSGRRKEHDNA